jgi:uncharacterized protein (DUF58 family)
MKRKTSTNQLFGLTLTLLAAWNAVPISSPSQPVLATDAPLAMLIGGQASRVVANGKIAYVREVSENNGAHRCRANILWSVVKTSSLAR